MFRYSFFIGLASLFFLCSACRTPDGKPVVPPVSDSIVFHDDTLRVATLSMSISYYEKCNSIMGYEYETASRFAKSVSRPVKFILGEDADDLVRLLSSGQVDMVAYPLIVSNDYKKKVIYTDNSYQTCQVLVQRLPSKPQPAKRHHKSRKGHHKRNHQTAVSAKSLPLVTDVTQLLGKNVYVMPHSKYDLRMQNLNEEIGGDIHIYYADSLQDEEDLIDLVAKGKLDFTVVDEMIAKAVNGDYSNLNISTPVSFDQKAAWAVRDSSLLRQVNAWVASRSNAKWMSRVYNKYFVQKHFVVPAKRKIRVVHIPAGSHEISNFDPYFRQECGVVGWDWRLIASIARIESKFNPNARGWGGYIGLMQMSPQVCFKYGAASLDDAYDPQLNVRYACRYLKRLASCFSDALHEDRVKFTLASYNVGIGHVNDARALAKKLGKNPNVWTDNVEYCLLLKSNPAFFRDPVVKHGYLRANVACAYVDEIVAYYHEYLKKVKK